MKAYNGGPVDDEPVTIQTLNFSSACNGAWLATDYDSYYYSQDEQRPLPILDFSFWYGNRTVWEVGMIILNLGGAAVSGIGLWIGLKRLGRWLKRITKLGRIATNAEKTQPVISGH